LKGQVKMDNDDQQDIQHTSLEESILSKHGMNDLTHRDEFIQHMKLGEHIQAIKLLREDRPGLGLKDAKDKTEAIMADLGIQKKSGCYIATACYGSYDHPDVLVLRRFRDDKLKTSALGRLFMHAYYIVSPRLACRLTHTSRLARFIRQAVLEPFVRRRRDS
jgi:hypothetical protein